MEESAKSKVAAAPADNEKLLADLEKYRQMALDMSATEAIIAPASDLVQSIRVRMLCFFPRCPNLGTSYWCPPSWGTPFEVAQAMKDSYKYAIFFRLLFPPEWFTGPCGGGRWRGGTLKTFIDQNRDYWEPEQVKYWQDYIEKHGVDRPGPLGRGISLAIEAEARKDGHHFAVTTAAGSCSTMLCGEKYNSRCIMLRTGLCRFPTKARPDGACSLYTDWLRTLPKLGRGWRYANCSWSILPEDMDGFEVPPGSTTIVLIE